MFCELQATAEPVLSDVCGRDEFRTRKQILLYIRAYKLGMLKSPEDTEDKKLNDSRRF